jgi:hypothetical protein
VSPVIPTEKGDDLIWLWILIGVVVAAAIVLIIVFTLPKEEPNVEIHVKKKTTISEE